MSAKNFKILNICLIAALLTMAAAATASAEKLEVVTINANQIMQNHPAFVEAQQTLQSAVQQMRKDMEGKSEQEQQQMEQQMQQKLQQRSQQLQQEALEKVKQDIQEIADERGYDYVMDANSLLAGGKDVTEEIMEAISEKD